MKKICIFGDSLIWGRGLPARVSWSNLLRNYLDQKSDPYSELYDLGVDRNTTEDLLHRFDVEAEARKPEIIIIAIGINDSLYRKNKENPEVSIDKFKNNLEMLIKKSRKYTKEIVFVGIVKGSDNDTKPLKYSTTKKSYDKENARIYNNIIEEVCENENVMFVNIIDVLIDEDFYDGIHPNEGGHKKIFKEVLKKTKRILVG